MPISTPNVDVASSIIIDYTNEVKTQEDASPQEFPNAASSIKSLIKNLTNNNNNINNNFNALNGKSSAYNSNSQVSNISNRLNSNTVNSENVQYNYTRKVVDPLAEQIGRLSVYKNYKPLNYNPFESLPTEGMPYTML